MTTAGKKAFRDLGDGTYANVVANSTTRASVTASVTAQNSFTDPLPLSAGDKASVSVSGTFNTLVTLQRRFGAGAWADIPNPDGSFGFAGPTQQTYEADESCELRLGVKTGDFTSGTVECRLGKG